MLYGALGKVGIRVFAAPFSPASLFAAGEQGVWYDPSDFSTMFQDSAETTPVTAVEQPVGRILDKSGRGNHATQATSASRPVLSARVNLLTYSEQFNNAAWAKGSFTGTISANTLETTDPLGTNTADKFTAAAINNFVSQAVTTEAATYTYSFYAKAGTASSVRVNVFDGTDHRVVFSLVDGTASGETNVISKSAQSVGNGWWRLQITYSAAAISNSTRVLCPEVGSIYVWGADLRPTNQATIIPPYQRIAAATDYDTTGFPYYLKFDGADDFLTTASINPGAGVKAQIFAGVRAETPRSNNSPVWQFGDTTTTATDALLRILTGDGSTDSYRASLNGSGANLTPRVTKVVPYTVVFSTLYDAAATGTGEISLRENGTVTASGSATDSGITSFGSQILYIGRQAAAAGYLNGKIYSLIVRFGANLDATTITNTETWVDGRTMAY